MSASSPRVKVHLYISLYVTPICTYSGLLECCNLMYRPSSRCTEMMEDSPHRLSALVGLSPQWQATCLRWGTDKHFFPQHSSSLESSMEWKQKLKNVNLHFCLSKRIFPPSDDWSGCADKLSNVPGLILFHFISFLNASSVYLLLFFSCKFHPQIMHMWNLKEYIYIYFQRIFP